MPEYLAPGVYVEETSFRAKSIQGVTTSTAGFVGAARYGPVHGLPEFLTSLKEFELVYGGGSQLEFRDRGTTHNYLWHAVRAFFEEGGRRLYVRRVFQPTDDHDSGMAYVRIPQRALSIKDSTRGTIVVRARYPGAAGNLHVRFTLRRGPNILSRDAAGNATLTSALVENDVVWIGDRVHR